jgi:hypothetical protein
MKNTLIGFIDAHYPSDDMVEFGDNPQDIFAALKDQNDNIEFEDIEFYKIEPVKFIQRIEYIEQKLT